MFIVGLFPAFYGAVDIGNDGVGARNIVLKFGDDRLGVCDTFTNIRNGGLGVHDIVANVGNHSVCVSDIVADVGNDGMGAHDITMNVGNYYACVYRKFCLEAYS